MHPNTRLPDPATLPAELAAIVEPCHQAVERWKEMRERTQAAKTKLGAAERQMAQAHLAAARDDEAKVPADRRPALKAAVADAERLEKLARQDAKAAWHTMSRRLKNPTLLPVLDAMSEDSAAAAAAYAEAVDAAQHARNRFHEATALRRWASDAVIPFKNSAPSVQAPSYRPEKKPTTVRKDARSGELDAMEVFAALRADAAGVDRLKVDEAQRLHWLAKSPMHKQWSLEHVPDVEYRKRTAEGHQATATWV